MRKTRRSKRHPFPGGLNCLNGVFGQWTDSVPVLYISGQVKFVTTLASCPELPLRQLGDQEVDIITSVKHLTKYAAMIKDPLDVKYHLDRAIYEATHGRFGPVWLDVPMNVQTAMIDESALREFVPPAPPVYDLKIEEVASRLAAAKPIKNGSTTPKICVPNTPLKTSLNTGRKKACR